jgi:hypothetical protein
MALFGVGIPLASTTEAGGQAMTLERPALLWGESKRPEGTTRYWDPEKPVEMGATMVSVYYRPLTPEGERRGRVGMIPPRLLAHTLSAASAELERSHAAGVKVIGYADCIMFNPQLLEEEGIDAESLYALDPEGNPVGNTIWDPSGIFVSCINNPGWLDLQKRVTRITAEAGFDGLMLDAYPLALQPGYQCHCPYCVEGWKRQSEKVFGGTQAMPGDEKGVLDLSRRVDREYLVWRLESYVDFVKAIDDDVLNSHPDFRLVMNHAADTLDFAYQAIHGAFRYPSTECNHVRLGEQPALYMFRFSEALMSEPMLTVVNSPAQIEPGFRYRVLMAEACAGGASVYAVSAMGDGDSPGIAKQWYDFMGANDGWLSGFESAAEVGLLYSWADHAFVQQERYGPAFSLGQGKQYYRRAAEYLGRHQIPYDCVVMDRGLERGSLARYRTLVCPNVRLVSDADASVLKEFVSGGGNLVIIGEWGTLREAGGEIQPRGTGLFPPSRDHPGGAGEKGKTEGGSIDRFPLRVISGGGELQDLPEPLEECRVRIAPGENMTATVRRNEDRIAIHLVRMGDSEVSNSETIELDYSLPPEVTIRSATAVTPELSGSSLSFSWRAKENKFHAEISGMKTYVLLGLLLE